LGNRELKNRKKAHVMQEQQIWQKTLERLRTSIKPDAFSSWFQETAALSWQDGVFVVGVPTTFTRTHLEVRYFDQIRSALNEVVGSPVDVRLTVSRSLLLKSTLSHTQSDEKRYESNIVTFLVVITKESFGYQASVPDIPGCVATGKTRQEAVQEVREALQTYLEMSHNDHAPVPEPQTTAEYLRLPLSLDQKQSDTAALHDPISITAHPSQCSFCQTPQAQGVRLTIGPGGFSICNECVEYCREMIEEGTVDFQQIKQALASRRSEGIQ
jgi:predicted RNase H-like HicB family nuclease